jgi:hypothetical protein
MSSKHRGTLGRCVATSTNKWQQKRMKINDGMTLNVNHELIDGTQGAKQKVKSLPSSFKNKSFSLLDKNKIEL